MTPDGCSTQHPRSILHMSGSPQRTREPRGVAASHAAAATKLRKHGEVSTRFGSHNGLSVTKSRIRFLWGLESLYYPTKLPEPGGCHHRPVPQSYGSLSRRTAGHGNLGLYLSAQAKNSVGRAPTRNPNHQPDTKEETQTKASSKGDSSSKRNEPPPEAPFI